MSIQNITKMAIVMALYVSLTYVFAFMSYGNIQFRIAEVLILLVYFKKEYAIPLVIGTAIANLASPLGIIDLAYGTAGTFFAVLAIMFLSKFKDHFKPKWLGLFLASLMPVFFNALLVGYELQLVFDYPYWPTALSVAIGEASVVSVFGVLIFTLLQRNTVFFHLITGNGFIEHPEDK